MKFTCLSSDILLEATDLSRLWIISMQPIEVVPKTLTADVSAEARGDEDLTPTCMCDD